MMARFMVELQWDYVTAVYSNDVTGRESLKAFKEVSRTFYICIAEEMAVNYESSPSAITTIGVVYLGSEGIGIDFVFC